MQVKLSRRNDRSEEVSYNTPDFPAHVRHELLSAFPNFSFISHWHDDVEFTFVRSGHMDFTVNGTTMALHEGECAFVNTRQLHSGSSEDMRECELLSILLHPLLLCSSPYVEERYILPVIENPSMPYLILHPGREHEQEILDLLVEMYQSRQDALFALEVQRLFFGIWEHLFLLSGHVERRPALGVQQLSALKDMIRFIYKNYGEKISLAQISSAGNVGKTTCCAIFQKYTNSTPVSYLTNYRIQKSMELLEATDRTILEICFDTGFSSASYFTETFRRLCGCTPTEYRRNAAEKAALQEVGID